MLDVEEDNERIAAATEGAMSGTMDLSSLEEAKHGAKSSIMYKYLVFICMLWKELQRPTLDLVIMYKYPVLICMLWKELQGPTVDLVLL